MDSTSAGGPWALDQEVTGLEDEMYRLDMALVLRLASLQTPCGVSMDDTQTMSSNDVGF